MFLEKHGGYINILCFCDSGIVRIRKTHNEKYIKGTRKSVLPLLVKLIKQFVPALTNNKYLRQRG